jgi:hypothetical protein
VSPIPCQYDALFQRCVNYNRHLQIALTFAKIVSAVVGEIFFQMTTCVNGSGNQFLWQPMKGSTAHVDHLELCDLPHFAVLVI